MMPARGDLGKEARKTSFSPLFISYDIGPDGWPLGESGPVVLAVSGKDSGSLLGGGLAGLVLGFSGDRGVPPLASRWFLSMSLL